MFLSFIFSRKKKPPTYQQSMMRRYLTEHFKKPTLHCLKSGFVPRNGHVLRIFLLNKKYVLKTISACHRLLGFRPSQEAVLSLAKRTKSFEKKWFSLERRLLDLLHKPWQDGLVITQPSSSASGQQLPEPYVYIDQAERKEREEYKLSPSSSTMSALSLSLKFEDTEEEDREDKGLKVHFEGSSSFSGQIKTEVKEEPESEEEEWSMQGGDPEGSYVLGYRIEVNREEDDSQDENSVDFGVIKQEVKKEPMDSYFSISQDAQFKNSVNCDVTKQEVKKETQDPYFSQWMQDNNLVNCVVIKQEVVEELEDSLYLTGYTG